jgi:hypothetical protein
MQEMINETIKPHSFEKGALPASKMPLRRRVLILISAVVSLMIPLCIAVQLRPSIESGRGDFKYLYVMGKMVLSGGASKLYEPGALLGVSNAHGPLEALLFAPLAALPFDQALWFWWVSNLILAYASLFLLLPIVPKVWAQVEFALLSLGIFLPMLIAEVTGQDTILTLFLFAICFRSLTSGRFWIAGSALAVSMYRPNLALPLIAMLALTSPGSLSIVAGFIATSALLLVVSIAALGAHTLLAYPASILRFKGSNADSFVPDMPNVRGLITWILRPHLSQGTILLLIAGISMLLIAVSVWFGQTRNAQSDDQREHLSFALFVIASLLVAYHDYAYDLTLLLLPLLLLWNWSGKPRRRTIPRMLLKYSSPALVCFSALVLVKPHLYTCAIVLLFVLICWELRSSRKERLAIGSGRLA